MKVREIWRVHFLVKVRVILGGLELFAGFEARLEGGTDEVRVADAGDFNRVLEGEEQSCPGALVGLHGEDAFAVHENVARGDLVVWMAGNDLRKRAFAGPVRTHDGVDASLFDFQVEAAQDFLTVFDPCV